MPNVMQACVERNDIGGNHRPWHPCQPQGFTHVHCVITHRAVPETGPSGGCCGIRLPVDLQQAPPGQNDAIPTPQRACLGQAGARDRSSPAMLLTPPPPFSTSRHTCCSHSQTACTPCVGAHGVRSDVCSALTGTEPRLGLHANGGPHTARAQSAATSAASRSSDNPAAAEQPPELAVPRVSPAGGRGAAPAATDQSAVSSAEGHMQPPSSPAPAAALVAQPDPLGLGRPVLVFSRQAVADAEQGARCAGRGSCTSTALLAG